MKKISLLTLAMVSSLVHGQARADQVDSKDASAPAQARRRSYISVLFGDGRTSDGDTLGRKAYQLRMGESVGEKPVSTWSTTTKDILLTITAMALRCRVFIPSPYPSE